MATITAIIAAMMEGRGDRVYNKNKCGDGIVGTDRHEGGRGWQRLGRMIPIVPSQDLLCIRGSFWR
jgi:hypothetical protein